MSYIPLCLSDSHPDSSSCPCMHPKFIGIDWLNDKLIFESVIGSM